MTKWLVLSIFVFAAVNWFVRPMFPEVAQHVPHFTVWASAGCAAIIMGAVLLLKK